MATTSIRAKGKEKKTFYLRLSIERGRVYERSTQITIPSEFYSTKTGLPKTGDVNRQVIIDKLNRLETFIVELYNKADDKGLIDSKWLGNKIAEFNGNKIKGEDTLKDKVTDWIDHIIENAEYRENDKGGYGLSEDRVRQYRNIKTLVSDFEKSIEEILLVSKVDSLVIKAFEKFMKERKYQDQTIKKKVTDLKSICREARKNGVELSIGFDQIKVGSAKTYDDDMDVIYLSIPEINKIRSIDLDDEPLINARKWLLALCFTGQRGIDLVGGRKNDKFYSCQLIKDNFKVRPNGKLALSIRQSKGNKQVLIPILGPVKEMYEKGLPYPMTLQKLRGHFKDLGKLSGIDTPTMGVKQEVILIGKERTRRGIKKIRPKYEYMATHIGRRSFCTNFYGILSTKDIKRITGHSKDVTLLKYINESTDDHIDNAEEAYNKIIGMGKQLESTEFSNHLKIAK